MKYETAVAIGRGAVGEVFKAWDPQTQRFVALKMFPPGSEAVAQRHGREARAQGRLQHPAICEVFEVGTTEAGRPFIAMRFVDGEPLDVVAPQLSLTERVRLVRQIADAIGCAHREGLIHRDLKPSNLLIEQGANGEYRPFVLDFGLVHIIEATPLTETGQILGTPGYLSPEQARGSALVDARSDVFSLGIILYQVLTGELPFDAPTTVGSLLKVLEHEPPLAHRLRQEVPSELSHIAQKAMEKDPPRRYADADAFGQDLDRFLATETPTARGFGWWGRWLRRLERRPLPWLVGALLLLLTLGSWGWSVYQGYQAAQETRQAELFARRSSAIEAQLRFLQLLPRRPLGDDLERLHIALGQLAEEVSAARGRARAAGRYAIGRAELALGKPEQALASLRQAQTLGFEDPVGALTLAQASLAMARRDLRLVDLLPDAQVRAAERQRLRETLKVQVLPDLATAAAAAPTEDGSRLLAQALLALLSDRPQEALPLAKTVSEGWPWLFEAHLLEADAHRDSAAQAIENNDDWSSFHQSLKEEQQVLEEALLRAPSAATLHQRLCESRLAETRGQGSRGGDLEPLLAIYAAAEVDCRRAREIDPLNLEAGRVLAEIAWRRALETLRWQGPAEAQPRAVDAVTRALVVQKEAPDSPWESWNLGNALFARAEVERQLGESVDSTLAEAASALQTGLEAAPGLAFAWQSLGHVWSRHGEALVEAERDPRPSYRKALMAYDRGLQGSRLHQSRVFNGICNAQNSLAYALMQYPEPPLAEVEEALESALSACQEALHRDPEYLAALSNLPFVYWSQVEWLISRGRSPKAAAEQGLQRFEELLVLAPNHASGLNNRAGLLAAVGRWRLDEGGDEETPETLRELVTSLRNQRRNLAPIVERFPRDATLHEARLAVLEAAALCRLQDVGPADGSAVDQGWKEAEATVQRLEVHRPSGTATALRRVELHRRRAQCAHRQGEAALADRQRRAALRSLSAITESDEASVEVRQERAALELLKQNNS